MINKKYLVFGIDLILVVGSFLVIWSVYNYSQPVLLSPPDELVTTENAVLFEFDKAGVILIDDNVDFTSPQEIYAENNLVVNLKPGVYYWKVKGAVESEIRQFTIKSAVELKLKRTETGDGYRVVNAGNTRLNVDVYEKGEYVDSVVLKIDEEKEVSGTTFIGEEEENG
ncbi:hypothetical protein HYV50_00675 [Candidatus Pacearchaeota archaeon]|nr:hypothetical protein [Candidatus Pacearchaeota archaeon]